MIAAIAAKCYNLFMLSYIASGNTLGFNAALMPLLPHVPSLGAELPFLVG